MSRKYDFVAIGDIVTDAFIHLKEASAHIDVDKGTREICMRFADKIPYEDVFVVPAVGNSANAAVAASRLGLSSALISNVGGDYFGEECLAQLQREKVSTDFMVIHKGMKTNYHYVLWFDDDRTILVKHETYPYGLPDFDDPKWVYLSSMGENSLPFHKEIEEYLSKKPDVRLAFQPGTFQMKFGTDALRGIYARTDVFFCNKEEAQRILKTKEDDIKKLLSGVRELGPKIVVITDGPKGAYTFDGAEILFLRAYPDPKPAFERTGAGDAFSSTFTVALALGRDVREALMWGPVNSMAVVQKIGAQAGLLSEEEIHELLLKAPSDYVPQKI